MNEYTIKLNSKQIRILIKLLDLQGRIAMGQFGSLGEFIADCHNTEDYSQFNQHPMNQALIDLRRAAIKHHDVGGHGSQSGCYFSINSEQVAAEAKVGYDLMKVLQKAVAKKEKHSPMSVWHDGSIYKISDEPVAECTYQIEATPEQLVDEVFDEPPDETPW